LQRWERRIPRKEEEEVPLPPQSEVTSSFIFIFVEILHFYFLFLNIFVELIYNVARILTFFLFFFIPFFNLECPKCKGSAAPVCSDFFSISNQPSYISSINELD
jgi:hypothetical protein